MKETTETGGTPLPAPPFIYTTSTQWTEGHLGWMQSPDKPGIQIHCPPPFCDVRDDKWSPESFFVAAVESCLLMTFVWMAERGGVEFEAYESRAEGRVEPVEGKMRFTRIDIRPTIRVADERAARRVRSLLRGAERVCLVSGSIACETHVEAEILAGTKG